MTNVLSSRGILNLVVLWVILNLVCSTYLEENFEIVSTLYTKCTSPRGFLAFLDFGLSRGEVSDFLKIWSLVGGNFGFDLC